MCGNLKTGYCRQCGKEYKVNLGDTEEIWILEIAGRISDSLLCDECEAKREAAERKAEERRELERKLVKSGIPLTRIDWKREQGNGALYDWVYERRDKSLLVADDFGTNKTWVFCAIGARLLDFISVRYWNVNALLSKYTALKMESPGYADKFTREQASFDLLILDDLGKQRITESAGAFLYSIADRIYMNGNNVWVSANNSANEIINMFDAPDNGRAFVSRLQRMCDVWPRNGGGR